MSRETLRLPEPARTLWTRIRDPLKTALVPRAGAEPRLKLGGGTILKGKLERGEDVLARDLLDVIVAAQQEPESLEVAVNAVEPPYARLVMGVWEAAAETIGATAGHEIGVAAGADPRELGPRASEAIRDRMYAGMRIEARKALILVTTTAGDGVERTRTMLPAEARSRFESEGLNAALSGMRQNANDVRRAATAAAEADRDEIVLRAGA